MGLAPCHISGTLNFEVALDLYKICVPLRRNSQKNEKFPGLSHAVTLLFWLYDKKYISFVHNIKTQFNITSSTVLISTCNIIILKLSCLPKCNIRTGHRHADKHADVEMCMHAHTHPPKLSDHIKRGLQK